MLQILFLGKLLGLMVDYSPNQYKERDIMNFFDFKDKTVLITGGASGLGFEMAKGFVESGAKVVIASRNEKKLKTACDKLSMLKNGEVSFVCFDISQEKSIVEMLETVSEKFDGKLNVVINSSGFNVRNNVEDVALEEWNAILGTNLTGAFLLSKHTLPLLKNADFGRLINVTSIFSTVTFPQRVSYSSSKGGMLLMSKTLALEWAEHGITVNSISPGPFLTEINKAVLDNPENYNKFCENIPLRRFGNPEEITSTALFLASEKSSYITGTDIKIDGGWTSC
jgi:NAD(P)-dependent dehydrogenase (short-subunit alcohol dehydrogenase family)